MEQAQTSLNLRSPLYQLYRSGKLHKISIPGQNSSLLPQSYLGEGSYGIVFSAYHPILNDMVAVKLFLLDSASVNDEYKAEYSAYNAISKSPNCSQYIICLYDAFIFEVEDREFGVLEIGVLVTELMASDVYKCPPNRNELFSFILSTLRGINEIHKKNLAHRDIKPQNILRSLPGKEPLFKIGDTGHICGNFENSENVQCNYTGTDEYLSPYALHHIYQKTTIKQSQLEDSWAWGKTLYMILYYDLDCIGYGVEQFETNSGLYNTPNPCNIPNFHVIYELLRRSLVPNWEKRASIGELLTYFEIKMGIKS